MFNSISWGQYFTTVFLFVIIYYVYVGIRYYRWEILKLIGIKKVEQNTISISTVSNFKKSFEAETHADYLPKPEFEIDISPLVQSFTDEISAYIQGSESATTKSELLHSIQTIVLKYPALKNADYKQELVEFLLGQTNSLYPDLLNQDDVQKLLT